MAMITPLTSEAIGRLEKAAFGTSEKLATDAASPSEVCQWLANRHILSESGVVVRWNDDLAIQIN
jgi:hypothetical protein